MKALILIVAAASTLLSATRVLDTLYDGRGNRADGSCTLTWPNFTSPDGSQRPIGGGGRTVRIRNGVIDLTLEPTAANVTYTVRCTLANTGSAPVEYWAVPVSGSAVNLAAVRTNAPGSAPPGGGGGGSSSLRFVDAETPAGTMNGSNRTFTLSQPPSPAASLKLYRNGLLQLAGADYAITGLTVTFVVGAEPQAGDLLAAYYRY